MEIMNRQGCVNHPDNFCYICGKYMLRGQRKNLSNQVKIAYRFYFGYEVGGQDKSWAPHVCCALCHLGLTQWLNGKRKEMPFAVPMVWREPTNHHSDCYFCLTKITGFSKKNKSKIVYPDCKSAVKPVPHDLCFAVPVPPGAAAGEKSDSSRECNNSNMNDRNELYKPESRKPHLLSREELNDLVRELSLSKEKAELLGSRLHQWNFLQEDAVAEELEIRLDIKIEDVKPERGEPVPISEYREPFPTAEYKEPCPAPEYTESFSEGQYVCKMCGRSFLKKCHLGMHIFMHSYKKKYICGVCREHLPCRHKLIEHRKLHRGTVEHNGTVTVRDEKRATTSKYHEHINSGCSKCAKPKVVSAEEVHCEFCGKQFNHRNSLMKHRQIHTGEGRCTCDVCGKQFTQKGNLNRHMKIHTDERDFECSVCKSLFRQKSHLKSHLKTHRRKV